MGIRTLKAGRKRGEGNIPFCLLMPLRPLLSLRPFSPLRPLWPLIFLISLLLASAQATTLERGLSPAIEQENQPALKEIFRIKIENKTNGEIAVSEDSGETWDLVGRVLYPIDKVNENGYSASKWMEPGRIVATSVNAIHIKAGAATDECRTIFSLLPREMLLPPRKYRSYLSPNSSIYTDIPAGESVFGGGYSPFVGNRVIPLPEDYVPRVGDVFYVVVEQPVELPREMVIENRFGGRITVKYPSGEEKLIGEVLRPVSGIGRFEGSIYADPGRIRANHAGVIDVSVSPHGSLGGFQIVPALHGAEMTYIRRMTQWMVIGPARADDPSLEGMAPFYRYFIRPNYRADDLEAADWEKRLLERYLVEVRYEGEEGWKPMPVYSLHRKFPLPHWADRVFDKASYFRILFPVTDG